MIFLSLVLKALFKGRITLGKTGKTFCGAFIIRSIALYWASLRISKSLSDNLKNKMKN